MYDRHTNFHSDLFLSIVRVDENWSPKTVFNVPPSSKVVFRSPVASFDEAHEDLIRCVQIAMQLGLREWAMIETAGAGT